MIRASLNIHLCSTGILSKRCLNSEIEQSQNKNNFPRNRFWGEWPGGLRRCD